MFSAPKKLFWMFTPLVVAFVLLGVAVMDLKHPQVSTDKCELQGRGLSVQDFKTRARMLYSRGGKPEDDLAFHCKTNGDVMVNDYVPFAVDPGQPVNLVRKDFHYMPTRYYLNLAIEADPANLPQ